MSTDIRTTRRRMAWLRSRPTWCLADECQFTIITGRRRLWSSNVATYEVPRTRTSLSYRSFTVAGPRFCTSPPTWLSTKTHLFCSEPRHQWLLLLEWLIYLFYLFNIDLVHSTKFESRNLLVTLQWTFGDGQQRRWQVLTYVACTRRVNSTLWSVAALNASCIKGVSRLLYAGPHTILECALRDIHLICMTFNHSFTMPSNASILL